MSACELDCHAFLIPNGSGYGGNRRDVQQGNGCDRVGCLGLNSLQVSVKKAEHQP